jgi:chemosensory pili system protein ChpA (sensor histidine kinase/response regulator)
MDEMFDENENENENDLSPEDLDVLRAFDAKDDWMANAPSDESATSFSAKLLAEDEILQDDPSNWLDVFLPEAAEDIDKIRRALDQLEAEEHIDPARFVSLQRLAHKIRGAAGVVDCQGMAVVSQYVEVMAERIRQGMIFPVLGLHALAEAVKVLELALQNLLDTGQEGDLPVTELAEMFHRFNSEKPPSVPAVTEASLTRVNEPTTLANDEESASIEIEISRSPSRMLSNLSIPFIRVDARKIEQLVLGSEQLSELQVPLESAQEEYKVALQELRTVQGRIRHMQPQLSYLAFGDQSVQDREEISSSSLVARILQQPGLRSENGHRTRPEAESHKNAESLLRDELNMERYTEKDMLIRSLTEAISDVTIAATHVEAASTTLLARQQDYVAQVAALRSSTFLLCLVPLKSLISRLQHTISTSSQHITFEVAGEETEVDQTILDSLISPLSQMVRTCIADIATFQDSASYPCRIWLHASGAGNEIVLEIGFSMPVNGGAIETIREPMQRLNASYSLQRNETGGMSFLLRFPRSHGMSQCLIVRAGSQRLIVPFSQVWRIEENQRPELLYHLCDLLGFSRDPVTQPRIQPVLILLQSTPSRHQIGIAVDEVEGEIELGVKPLSSHLQRPGISGAAIDGRGNTLLMLDLPELLRHYTWRQQAGAVHSFPRRTEASALSAERQHASKILIADDSVSLRRSLGRTLRHAQYTVTETRDGMEALEYMLEEPPMLCLLDIEMPNLNGFDLLSIIHQHPELAHMKVIILTSRSSDQHVQRARELGAHAYLIKPCSQETLLETVQELLAS